MPADVATRPVGPADLADLADLFGRARTTWHCWCTAFCSSPAAFAGGWFGGGNRRRFAAMTAAATSPVGVLATAAGEPVGWAACGPRSRYPAATRPGHPVLGDRDPAEDPTVWLLPCLFVRPDRRGRGVPDALVAAVVALARRERAVALEAWPLATGTTRPAEAHLGRQAVFEAAGFVSVGPPSAGRVLLRLQLDAPGTPPVPGG